jgi:hypothetical protein
MARYESGGIEILALRSVETCFKDVKELECARVLPLSFKVPYIAPKVNIAVYSRWGELELIWTVGSLHNGRIWHWSVCRAVCRAVYRA